MQNRYTRTLRITAEQGQRLDQLADELNARDSYGKGHRVYLTRWQVVIRGICDGEYIVTARNPYQLPAGLAEQADAVLEQQRERERIAEQQRRVEMHTVAKQAVRKTPVKLVQMDMLTELEPA